MIIDAQDGLAFDLPHQLRHGLVLRPFKRHPIALGLPVRWVHVKQGMRPVVALDALLPVQVLDVGAGQTEVRSTQVFLDAQQVQRRGRGRRAPGLALHLAAEGVVLQVIKACRPLQVGHGLRRGVLQPLEHVSAGECPFELAHKLLEVMLQDTVQVDQFAVDVVPQCCRPGNQARQRSGLSTGDVDHLGCPSCFERIVPSKIIDTCAEEFP